ncbi:uncharacterized protein LOC131235701 [Magnolia sinica]|uniref:uncharacterized protein LOC131235701 n=1 Tax=Magnolia sinica TaxID=86752 RepID=UPI00265A56F5|nr:uncharacterized protein LOC131235701 [Magnolia sinica]
MEATPSPELPASQIPATSCQIPLIPSNLLQTFLSSTNSKTLDEALQSLSEASRTSEGRSHLASIKSLLPSLLSLLSHSLYPISLPLKILRNLCAGEILNQTSFIESDGIDVVAAALKSQPLDLDVARFGLQLLGNVSLAGEMHRSAVWDRFFPEGFEEIAQVRISDVVDPLCMVLCTCCEGSSRRSEEIHGDRGLRIVAEILTTASAVGFREDWLPALATRICFKESYLRHLFLELSSTKNSSSLKCLEAPFTVEQAFLLNLLSETINQQIDRINVSNDFALLVLEILKNASTVVDSISRGQSALPTGSPTINVLGYSLSILRDLCAREDPNESSSMLSTGGSETEGSMLVVDSLLHSGLLTLLLCLLHELEPPEIIRKSRAQEENQGKVCPYIGYRRDIVAVIGNCTFRRKLVQDEIRQQNRILLLMQQCVVDMDNPFLREWGIWAVRNLLEGNIDNQRQVAEMELQGSVGTPEISGLGLRVEVDQKTQRAKLVNIS